jgi:hypothetical protein
VRAGLAIAVLLVIRGAVASGLSLKPLHRAGATRRMSLEPNLLYYGDNLDVLGNRAFGV